MIWRKNILLAVVLLMLGSWYYFYEIRGSEHREKAAVEQKRLMPGVTIDSVDTVRLQRITQLPSDVTLHDGENLDYTLAFQKADSQWKLQEPVSAPCDETVVKPMVQQMIQLQKGRVIDDKPGSYSLYGLDSPAFHITIHWVDGEMELMLGDENPSGEAYYGSLADSSEVFLVSNDSIKEYLRMKAFDYRDRAILTGQSDTITGLTIKNEKLSVPVNLTKEDTEWLMTAPVQTMADSASVNKIISGIKRQKIQQFFDSPGDMAAHGLENPSISVALAVGDSLETRLEIGSPGDPGGKTFYARRNGKGPVFTIPRELVTELNHDAFYYRSKNICDLDNVMSQRIEFQHGSTELTVEKNDQGEWQLIKPEGMDIDSTLVADFISTVVYMRATGTMDESGDFGDSTGSIKFYEGSEEPVITLELGGQPADGVGRWIRNHQMKTVFRITEEDADTLKPDARRFMKKDIFNFDRKSLKSITITSDDETLKFEPVGNEFQTIPKSENFDTGILEEIYWTLHSLKFADILQELPVDPDENVLKQFGLNPPLVTIAVELANTTPSDLLIGFSHENLAQTVVMKKFDTNLLLVNTVDLQPVFNALDDLKQGSHEK